MMHTLNDTAHKILDIAENFTQTRGFNDFSYRDIQQELGIKTSSIHYYFPTKQDLAISMVARYIENNKTALKDIDAASLPALEKLQKLGDIFIETASQNKFCLCGMLMADIVAMPKEVVSYLREFFDLNKSWIAGVLKEGIASSEIKDATDIDASSSHYLASLEGALLIARTRNDEDVIKSIINNYIQSIKDNS